MDLQNQRTLQLLQEVEQNSCVTQRSLATKMGVALGLTNLYLKRLANKGFIKITMIRSHRIKYLLTSRGLAEKTRLTYQYMQHSLLYYRDIRQRLKQVLLRLSQEGSERIVLYGTGEIAELAYLTLREMGFALIGFVYDGERGKFLSYPLLPVEAISDWTYDVVLIADLTDAENIHARLLRTGIPKDKIVLLVLQK